MAHYPAAVLAVAPHAALTFQGWFWKDQRDGDADLPGDVGRGTGIFPALLSLFLALSELSCDLDSWPCCPPSPALLPLEPLSSGGFLRVYKGFVPCQCPSDTSLVPLSPDPPSVLLPLQLFGFGAGPREWFCVLCTMSAPCPSLVQSCREALDFGSRDLWLHFHSEFATFKCTWVSRSPWLTGLAPSESPGEGNVGMPPGGSLVSIALLCFLHIY